MKTNTVYCEYTTLQWSLATYINFGLYTYVVVTSPILKRVDVSNELYSGGVASYINLAVFIAAVQTSIEKKKLITKNNIILTS